eukprot:COSAG04_NODE_2085_length_4830_cov_6.275206_3_plen_72_part_00
MNHAIASCQPQTAYHSHKPVRVELRIPKREAHLDGAPCQAAHDGPRRGVEELTQASVSETADGRKHKAEKA